MREKKNDYNALKKNIKWSQRKYESITIQIIILLVRIRPNDEHQSDALRWAYSEQSGHEQYLLERAMRDLE